MGEKNRKEDDIRKRIEGMRERNEEGEDIRTGGRGGGMEEE